MWEARLQGSKLEFSQLQGADLRGANLYTAEGFPSETELIDARLVEWAPLGADKLAQLIHDLQISIRDKDKRQKVLDRLEKASGPGAPKLRLQSCLADFKKQLHAYFGEIACASLEIARGLIWQIWLVPAEKDSGSSPQGLVKVLKERLDDQKCVGLQGLNPVDKERLQAIK